MGVRITGDDFLWDTRFIPFQIDRTDFPAGGTNDIIIQNAITNWNASTVSQLVPYRGENNFVVFTSANETCSSQVVCKEEDRI